MSVPALVTSVGSDQSKSPAKTAEHAGLTIPNKTLPPSRHRESASGPDLAPRSGAHTPKVCGHGGYSSSASCGADSCGVAPRGGSSSAHDTERRTGFAKRPEDSAEVQAGPLSGGLVPDAVREGVASGVLTLPRKGPFPGLSGDRVGLPTFGHAKTRETVRETLAMAYPDVQFLRTASRWELRRLGLAETDMSGEVA